MRSDESDLILSLHQSAQENPPFAGFLGRLARHVQADAAVLVALGGSFAQGPSPIHDESALHRLRFARVYSGEELGGAVDAPFVRLMRLRTAAGDAWIWVARGRADFAASTSATLTLLASHLAASVERAAAHRHAATVAQKDADLLRRLGTAWVLLSQEGVVRAQSADAALILGYAPQIDGRLRGAGMAEALALVAKTGVPQVVTLPDCQVLLQREAGQIAAYMRRPVRQEIPPVHALSHSAGLAPAEARLALRLADGRSIAEAAHDLGLSLETARNYSKRIYAKMGLRGQNEVIAALQNSVIRLL